MTYIPNYLVIKKVPLLLFSLFFVFNAYSNSYTVSHEIADATLRLTSDRIVNKDRAFKIKAETYSQLVKDWEITDLELTQILNRYSINSHDVYEKDMSNAELKAPLIALEFFNPKKIVDSGVTFSIKHTLEANGVVRRGSSKAEFRRDSISDFAYDSSYISVEDQNSNFSAPGPIGVRLAIHEIAHAIDNRMGITKMVSNQNTINVTYKAIIASLFQSDPVSLYSTVNIHEYFAESVASFALDPLFICYSPSLTEFFQNSGMFSELVLSRIREQKLSNFCENRSSVRILKKRNKTFKKNIERAQTVAKLPLVFRNETTDFMLNQYSYVLYPKLMTIYISVLETKVQGQIFRDLLKRGYLDAIRIVTNTAKQLNINLALEIYY